MELVPNNITHFFRHQRMLTFSEAFKLNYRKNIFQSTYHTIMSLSESYYKTILIYSEIISNSIHNFTELLPKIVNTFLRV